MLKKETIENAYKKIGENVAKARKKRKMSQLALSLEMGYKSVSVISFAEICLNGAHFNLAHLMQISSILEVPLTTFFESVEEIIKNPWYNCAMKFYEFEIKESKKAVKYLRLKVGQSGEISLSIPLRTKENHILEFLEKNLEWLRKTSAKIKAKNSAKNENQVEFLGLNYELIIDKKASGVSIELFSIKAASKADFKQNQLPW